MNGRLANLRVHNGRGVVVARWESGPPLDTFALQSDSDEAPPARLVNAPTRSLGGPRWDGSYHHPELAPDHYDAVHFHDDDLEDAKWPVDVALQVPPDLESGIYAALLRSKTDTTFVPFFVRPRREARKPIVFLASTATYLAYGNARNRIESPFAELAQASRYDAFQTPALNLIAATIARLPGLAPSLYDTHRDGAACMIVSRRRPLLTVSPEGRDWGLRSDLDILAWLERKEFSYDVLTDEALHSDGLEALDGHRCVLTGTHPEYWSTRMLDSVQEFLASGGRLMYLGGNGLYWRVSFSDERPWLMECRKAETGARHNDPEPGSYVHQFGSELGGLWRRIGRAPQQTVGVGMTADGWDDGSPYQFGPDADEARVSFALRGINRDQPFGAHGAFGKGNGAAGCEIDRADTRLGTPPHALVIASSGPHSRHYYMAPEETLFLHGAMTGDVALAVRADIVFFETPNGGAVFSTGSVAWAASLGTNGFDNDVSLMTSNVLTRFSHSAPFIFPVEVSGSA